MTRLVLGLPRQLSSTKMMADALPEAGDYFSEDKSDNINQLSNYQVIRQLSRQIFC
jgi:hypothetical protein